MPANKATGIDMGCANRVFMTISLTTMFAATLLDAVSSRLCISGLGRLLSLLGTQCGDECCHWLLIKLFVKHYGSVVVRKDQGGVLKSSFWSWRSPNSSSEIGGVGERRCRKEGKPKDNLDLHSSPLVSTSSLSNHTTCYFLRTGPLSWTVCICEYALMLSSVLYTQCVSRKTRNGRYEEARVEDCEPKS